MMIPDKRKAKPLPLFWRRLWVFEFLTSIKLMCVKYNDDSCWNETKPLPLSGWRRWVFEFLTSVMLMCVKYNVENKTSSTLWKKALGRGAWQSWSKRPKGTHWLSWWRQWQNDHDHQREMKITMIITMIQRKENNENFYRSSSERTSGTGIAWGLNIMNNSSAWQTPGYCYI